jgi:SAM-dependent methyltransferase
VSATEEIEPPRSGYDEIAEGYARHWGPVIRPGAELVLDQLAPAIEAHGAGAHTPGMIAGSRSPALRLLDVGTGTGALALAALERWPAVHVTGIDPSGGMLELARRAAADRLPAAARSNLATAVAPADELPFEDGAFDHAMSSFVLQLVRSRAAALREVRRVLKPGGIFAWAAWQTSDRPYEPDRIANDELDRAGFDPPEGGGRPGDIASPDAAAAGMRRAGFREVRAHVTELAHRWDAAGYLAFFTQFDEESLFADLEPGERADIEGRISRRLRRLTAEQLTLRMPVIYVTGRAPD